MIPPVLTPQQISYTYASEADLLNTVLFGKTAKEWRDSNPDENEIMIIKSIFEGVDYLSQKGVIQMANDNRFIESVEKYLFGIFEEDGSVAKLKKKLGVLLADFAKHRNAKHQLCKK
mgnify:CR=1 FL=1